MYAFNFEEHVRPAHLLRGIDRLLDLGGLRQHLFTFYSQTDRPLIDPELMVRMLIIGDCFEIRSERRLCEEVRLPGVPLVLPRRPMPRSRITSPSRRADTGAPVRAMPSVTSSRASCAAA